MNYTPHTQKNNNKNNNKKQEHRPNTKFPPQNGSKNKQ